MNVVLVCLNNFQDYILDNILQLINLGVDSIYVITDLIFFDKFGGLSVKLVDCKELTESYDFYNKSNLDKNYRNGFWTLTSLRFFYIYDLMKKFDIKDVIHLENDVLLYYNPDVLIDLLDRNYFYIPFDSYRRNIASIIYIPNTDIFGSILDKYNFSLNDMENFVGIMEKTGMIQQFPIFHSGYAKTDEEKFVSKNFDKFNYIFDAAAIGQYIGGIDPNNNPGNTIGFINETCVIKYNYYKIDWRLYDGFNRPFLVFDDNTIVPIFNLHIHCKKLSRFIFSVGLFDIVICLGPSDREVIRRTISYTKKNILGHRNIYIVSYDNSISIEGVITIDEKIFPFNKDGVRSVLCDYGGNRDGWYLQQLIKFYAGRVIPGIMENYLVLDSDTYFLNPVNFIGVDGRYLYNFGKEHHQPYFDHMSRLHPSLKKVIDKSGICHHCMFNKFLLEELFYLVEKNYRDKYLVRNYCGELIEFWKIFLLLCDRKHIARSAASEYEIYFNFMMVFHPDKMQLRELRWKNSYRLLDDDVSKYDYISVHYYNNNDSCEREVHIFL